MRVKINYAIDLEEVPKIVSELLDKINKNCETIQNNLHQCKNLVADENMLKTIRKITNMREELLKIDECLDDCGNILTGYQSTILAENSREHMSELGYPVEKNEEIHEKNES